MVHRWGAEQTRRLNLASTTPRPARLLGRDVGAAKCVEHVGAIVRALEGAVDRRGPCDRVGEGALVVCIAFSSLVNSRQSNTHALVHASNSRAQSCAVASSKVSE